MDITYKVTSLKENYITVEYSYHGEATVVGFEIPENVTPEQVDTLISAHTPHNHFAILFRAEIVQKIGTVPFVDLTKPLGDQNRVSVVR